MQAETRRDPFLTAALDSRPIEVAQFRTALFVGTGDLS